MFLCNYVWLFLFVLFLKLIYIYIVLIINNLSSVGCTLAAMIRINFIILCVDNNCLADANLQWK